MDEAWGHLRLKYRLMLHYQLSNFTMQIALTAGFVGWADASCEYKRVVYFVDGMSYNGTKRAGIQKNRWRV